MDAASIIPPQGGTGAVGASRIITPLESLAAEVESLKSIVRSLSDRVSTQSMLLSKRAEKPSAAAENYNRYLDLIAGLNAQLSAYWDQLEDGANVSHLFEALCLLAETGHAPECRARAARHWENCAPSRRKGRSE